MSRADRRWGITAEGADYLAEHGYPATGTGGWSVLSVPVRNETVHKLASVLGALSEIAEAETGDPCDLPEGVVLSHIVTHALDGEVDAVARMLWHETHSGGR